MSSLSKAKYTWSGFHEGFGLHPDELEGIDRSDNSAFWRNDAPPALTQEQLEYAGRAAIDYFLKHDPSTVIADSSPLLRKLKETNMARSATEILYGPRILGGIVDDLVQTKPKKKDYNTVGVRFLRGHNLAKLYTYRVKKGVKLHLGQEVVVPTDPDKQGYNTNAIAVVVRIDPKPQDNGHWDYKTIVGTVKPL